MSDAEYDPLIENQSAFGGYYQQFRRHMRRLGLVEGLVCLQQIALHLQYNRDLPPAFFADKPAAAQGPLSEYLHDWEVDTLAREIIRHGRRLGGSFHLENWDTLADAVNFVRRMDNAASGPDPDGHAPDVLFALHRIAHRQFPWQIKSGTNPFIRTFKIYNRPGIRALVEAKFGMSPRQYMILGSAIAGYFLNNFVLREDLSYEVMGFDQSAQDSVYSRWCRDVESLRSELGQRPVLAQDWQFESNPLHFTPLLRTQISGVPVLLCPIPSLLVNRVTSGLYYDLAGTKGFDHLIGEAFQAYVGEIIRATCRPHAGFILREERSYHVGRSKKHGVDWHLSDQSGHLFIETKSKRLTLKAKTSSDIAHLRADLEVLANSIGQNYKNIADAKAGLTAWSPDELPAYNVVITLEEWFLLSPTASTILEDGIRAGLSASGLSLGLIDEIPYTVLSASEFEYLSQVIAQVGISAFMENKTSDKHRDWSAIPFAQSKFAHEAKRVQFLFADDARLLFPQSSDELKDPTK